MAAPQQISASKNTCRGKNYEACPNWIGGGATRPITQAGLNYIIFGRVRVNHLDDLRTNKGEQSFVNCRLQIKLKRRAIVIRLGDIV
jgi:hypothetical protein